MMTMRDGMGDADLVLLFFRTTGGAAAAAATASFLLAVSMMMMMMMMMIMMPALHPLATPSDGRMRNLRRQIVFSTARTETGHGLPAMTNLRKGHCCCY